MSNIAIAYKAKKPAFGFIVAILGEDMYQKDSWTDAVNAANKVNDKCKGLSDAEIRELYKLGEPTNVSQERVKKEH